MFRFHLNALLLSGQRLLLCAGASTHNDIFLVCSDNVNILELHLQGDTLSADASLAACVWEITFSDASNADNKQRGRRASEQMKQSHERLGVRRKKVIENLLFLGIKLPVS